eukprot:4633610-Prorocentrum_lima.AAC.1
MRAWADGFDSVNHDDQMEQVYTRPPTKRIQQRSPMPIEGFPEDPPRDRADRPGDHIPNPPPTIRHRDAILGDA